MKKNNKNNNKYLKLFSSKKSAIQLTMGFMVMLIIAIVVFVLSLNFLGQFFKQAEMMQKNLDEQTRNDISRLLAGNARVAIPKDTMTIKQGETDVIGIGIKNTISVSTFHIQIIEGKYYDTTTGTNAAGAQLSCSNGDCTCSESPQKCGYKTGTISTTSPIKYQISRSGTLSIPPNKDDTALMTLAVDKKAPPGLYSLSIGVCGLNNGANIGEDACKAAVGSDYTQLYGGTIYKVRITVR